MSKRSMYNKVVLVTGGAGLIGSSVCDYIVASGGVPISLDIRKSTSESALSVEVDCTNPAELQEAVGAILNKHRVIDGAVHCAYPRSENWGCAFEDLDYESLSSNLSLQLGSAILFSQVMYKCFASQGKGSFVHLASIQGISAPRFEHYEGTQMSSPIEYSAIKSGVISVTRWLAKYSFNTGVRFNCVSPGGVLDRQDPIFLDRYRSSCSSVGMLHPADVSSLVCFLLSDESKSITGQNFVVDDGWSL